MKKYLMTLFVIVLVGIQMNAEDFNTYSGDDYPGTLSTEENKEIL